MSNGQKSQTPTLNSLLQQKPSSSSSANLSLGGAIHHQQQQLNPQYNQQQSSMYSLLHQQNQQLTIIGGGGDQQQQQQQHPVPTQQPGGGILSLDSSGNVCYPAPGQLPAGAADPRWSQQQQFMRFPAQNAAVDVKNVADVNNPLKSVVSQYVGQSSFQPMHIRSFLPAPPGANPLYFNVQQSYGTPQGSFIATGPPQPPPQAISTPPMRTSVLGDTQEPSQINGILSKSNSSNNPSPSSHGVPPGNHEQHYQQQHHSQAPHRKIAALKQETVLQQQNDSRMSPGSSSTGGANSPVSQIRHSPVSPVPVTMYQQPYCFPNQQPVGSMPPHGGGPPLAYNPDNRFKFGGSATPPMITPTAMYQMGPYSSGGVYSNMPPGVYVNGPVGGGTVMNAPSPQQQQTIARFRNTVSGNPSELQQPIGNAGSPYRAPPGGQQQHFAQPVSQSPHQQQVAPHTPQRGSGNNNSTPSSYRNANGYVTSSSATSGYSQDDRLSETVAAVINDCSRTNGRNTPSNSGTTLALDNRRTSTPASEHKTKHNSAKESHPSTPAPNSPGDASLDDMESSLSSPSWPSPSPHTSSTQRHLAPPSNLAQQHSMGPPMNTPSTSATPVAGHHHGAAKEPPAAAALNGPALVQRMLGDFRQFPYPEWEERRRFLEHYVQFCEASHLQLTGHPSVSKQIVDLFQLYKLVKQNGGYVDATKKKYWRQLCDVFSINVSNSASGQIKKQYAKYLLPYECYYDLNKTDPGPIIKQCESKKKHKPKKSAATAAALAAAAAASGSAQQATPPSNANNHNANSNNSIPTNSSQCPSSISYQQLSNVQSPYGNNGQQQAGLLGQVSQQQQQRPSSGMGHLQPKLEPSNETVATNPFEDCTVRQQQFPGQQQTTAQQQQGMIPLPPHHYPSVGAPGPLPPQRMLNPSYPNPNMVSYSAAPLPYPPPPQGENHYGPPPQMQQPYSNSDSYPKAMLPDNNKVWPEQQQLPVAAPQQTTNVLANHQVPYPAMYSAPSTVPPASVISPPNQYIVPSTVVSRLGGHQAHVTATVDSQQQAYGQRLQPGYCPPPAGQQPPASLHTPPQVSGQPPYGNFSTASTSSSVSSTIQQTVQSVLNSKDSRSQQFPYAQNNSYPQSSATPNKIVPSADMNGPGPSLAKPLTISSSTWLGANYYRKESEKPFSFPANSVEATMPRTLKRKKLLSRDIGKVDAWRIIMALKSGLNFETSWALNMLTVLLYDDSCVGYFDLKQWPSLFEILVHLYERNLRQVFDDFNFVDDRRDDDKSCVLENQNCSKHDEFCISDYCDDESERDDKTVAMMTSFVRYGKHGGNRRRLPLHHVPAEIDRCESCEKIDNHDDEDASSPRKRFKFGKSSTGPCDTDDDDDRLFLIDHKKSIIRSIYDDSVDAECSDEISIRCQPPVVDDTVETSRRRSALNICVTVSNIIRGLSFVPGNEIFLAQPKWWRFLRLESHLCTYVHSHLTSSASAKRRCRPMMMTSSDETPLTVESIESISVENQPEKSSADSEMIDLSNRLWYYDDAQQLADDALTIFCNLAANLDLYDYEERTVERFLSAVVHWAVCRAPSAGDPMTSSGDATPPHRMALEILSKLSVYEKNVDLILATPPWSRIETLIERLCSLLCMAEDVIGREFSIVLLNAFANVNPVVCVVAAVNTPIVHYLISFLEYADAEMHRVLQFHGMTTLRDNPEIIGTSVGMLRRAASILLAVSKLPTCRRKFDGYEMRLINFTMSQLMDTRVGTTIAEVLFELQDGSFFSSKAGGNNNVVTASANQVATSSSHVTANVNNNNNKINHSNEPTPPVVMATDDESPDKTKLSINTTDHVISTTDTNASVT